MSQPLNKKLRAFTLAETLVVMLLSGIIIGFFYYGLRFVGNDFKRLTTGGDYNQELALFVKTFRVDLLAASSVKQSGSSLIIELKEGSVSYSNANDSIHRTEIHSNNTDTARTKTFFINGAFALRNTPKYFCAQWIFSKNEEPLDTIFICGPRGSNTHINSNPAFLNPKTNQ